MFLNKSYSLIFFTFIFLSYPVFAQSQDVQSVDRVQVDELIQTLESETAREDFIQNLKTLIEVDQTQDKQDISLPAISETLGIEKQTKDFIDGYSDFLAENNLNASTVGKFGLTGAAFLGALIVGFLVKKLTMILLKKLLALKRKYSLSHSRFNSYVRIIRFGLYSVLSLLFFYSVALIWNISNFVIFQSDTALSLVSNIVNIMSIIIITAIVWEVVNGFIEYAVRRSGAQNSARARTILPIARNVLFMVFSAFFGLMLLSELGINIMPLLAGAGVLGIAIGFGAQTVVKDFLTGFTIIMEDLIQVGDVVTLAGRTGGIEKITIRKVQMRSLDGTVYTVPFSEIDIIENLTKNFSYYLLDVGIAYREDPDEVIQHLKAIDQEMNEDDKFKDLTLEPIEILGVDHFGDSAVIIKARLKTLPAKQWVVGREFNRRMKHKFDEHNVEMPFPHQTIYFGENKDGSAPAAPVKVKSLGHDDQEEKVQKNAA